MRNISTKIAMLGAVLWLAAVTAQASVTFTVTRLTDKTAIVTGSGTLFGATPQQAHVISFDSLLANVPANSNTYAFGAGSTMTIGGQSIDSAYDVGTGFVPFQDGNSGLYAFTYSTFNAGDAVAGTLSLQLTSAATFADIGSSGKVFWGLYANTFSTVEVGTYTVVGPNAVPEPASVALLGAGAMALALRRRRRK